MKSKQPARYKSTYTLPQQTKMMNVRFEDPTDSAYSSPAEANARKSTPQAVRPGVQGLLIKAGEGSGRADRIDHWCSRTWWVVLAAFGSEIDGDGWCERRRRQRRTVLRLRCQGCQASGCLTISRTYLPSADTKTRTPTVDTLEAERRSQTLTAVRQMPSSQP